MKRIAWIALLSAIIPGVCPAAGATAPDIPFAVPEPKLPLVWPKASSFAVDVGLRRPVQPQPTSRLLMMHGGHFVFDDSAPASVFGLIDLFGSAKNLLLALAAETIEIVALRESANPTAPGEEVAETAATLSPEHAGAMRGALTCDAAYNWDAEPGCLQSYEYRVKFRRGEKHLMVDVCLSCQFARVVSDGNVVAAKHVAYGFPTIAAVVEQYFPGATKRSVR